MKKQMIWALRLHGPRDLRLEEIPPPTPGPGDVLVRIAAVGICHTDIELWEGVHEGLVSGTQKYPFTPGHEWAGYVEAIGAHVTGWQPGELVVGETGIGCLRCPLCLSGHHQLCPQGTETGIVGRDGAMRQYHVHPADFVHRIAQIPAEQAALVEPASVGVYACQQAGVSPLKRVAIVGAGTIGLCALQAAKAFGAQFLCVVSRSQPKLELARRLGADAVVNSREINLVAAAEEMTEGKLFDIVIEAAGTQAAFREALLLGGYRSRIALVGLSSREPFRHGLETIIHREQTILGVRGSPHVYSQTIKLIEQGHIRLGELITHRFPLKDYAAAFALARAGGPDVIKVLLLL